MPQDNNPTVSVIVPCYNVAATLDEALESVEGQTLRNLEIICVNDGSTDSTLDILRAHANRDDRVRIIDKPNAGYGAACNSGIDAARGLWIGILEPDDWIEPTMYEDMVALAALYTDVIDIVKTPYWRIINADTPSEYRLNCSYKGRIRPKGQPFSINDAGVDHLLIHHPSIWSALYSARFMREHGIRFLEIPGAGWADNPFLVETLCQARTIVYLDRAYYCYREETADKSSSFVQRNPTVPFERWHDMVDVLDRLAITTPSVLRAQYRRGFTYLDYVANDTNLNDPTMRAVMQKMFARMHDDIVLSEPNIPPAWKSLYREMKGLPSKRENPLPYAAALAGAGVYSLQNVGAREVVNLVGAIMKRDAAAGNVSAGTEGEAGKSEGLEKLASAASQIAPEAREGVLAGESTSAAEAEAGPTFSIVMPVYNAAPYLAQSLASVAAQAYGNYELVCVNDGSTDDSARILEEHAARDERITVLHRENAGPSAARNSGMCAATGDYVCFLDADDELEPFALERIARELAQERYDAVVFGWSCFPEDAATDEWVAMHGNVREATYRSFAPPLLFNEMTNPFLRVAVRRTLLVEHGIAFDEGLRVGEDCAFLFSLFPRADSTRLIPDKLYRYRMPHEGSIMSASHDGTPGKCVDDIVMTDAIIDDWHHAGFLEPFGAPLMHWFIVSFLYTVLRQPETVRDELVSLVRQMWLARLPETKLRALDVPEHDKDLVSMLIGASDAGALGISQRELSTRLLSWRMAEYGPAHLAATTLERLMPS